MLEGVVDGAGEAGKVEGREGEAGFGCMLTSMRTFWLHCAGCQRLSIWRTSNPLPQGDVGERAAARTGRRADLMFGGRFGRGRGEEVAGAGVVLGVAARHGSERALQPALRGGGQRRT